MLSGFQCTGISPHLSWVRFFLLTILLELAPAVQLFLGRIRDRDLVKPFLRVPVIQQLPSIFMDVSCCNHCFSQLSELVMVRGTKLGPDPPDLLTHAGVGP